MFFGKRVWKPTCFPRTMVLASNKWQDKWHWNPPRLRLASHQFQILGTKHILKFYTGIWWFLILTESTFICVTFIFLEARPCSWRKPIGCRIKRSRKSALLFCVCTFPSSDSTQPCRICKSANSGGLVQSFTLGFQALRNAVLFISSVLI